MQFTGVAYLTNYASIGVFGCFQKADYWYSLQIVLTLCVF